MQLQGFFCIFVVMGKGRNKELIAERDKKLFERYYYWSEIKRLRFDDTINKLSHEEFFISEATTLRIIKRMLMEGATVNGEQIQRSRYMGFRCARASRASSKELSLFPQ